jgi:hypothetical protein
MLKVAVKPIIQVLRLEWKLQVRENILKTLSIQILNVSGIVKIFRRSEAKHLLRYTTFIGDGDANNEQALLDAKPYGDDIPIRRLQCVNHFSKR